MRSVTKHPIDDFYRNRCNWCARPNDGDAGDYYHQKDCGKGYIGAVLREAKKRAAPEVVIKWLEARYESTSYVGD